MKIAPLFLLPLALCLLSGCFLLSGFQSAHMLSPGVVEAGASFSKTYARDPEAPASTVNLGGRIGYGLNRRLDLYLDYSYVHFDKFNRIGYHYLAVEPKVCLVPDKVALTIPLGACFGRDVEFLQVVPVGLGTIFTLNVGDRCAFSCVPKCVLFIPSLDCLLGCNFGAEITFWDDIGIVWPEISCAYNPDVRKLLIAGGLMCGIRVKTISNRNGTH